TVLSMMTPSTAGQASLSVVRRIDSRPARISPQAQRAKRKSHGKLQEQGVGGGGKSAEGAHWSLVARPAKRFSQKSEIAGAFRSPPSQTPYCADRFGRHPNQAAKCPSASFPKPPSTASPPAKWSSAQRAWS